MAPGQFMINSKPQGAGWEYAYSEASTRAGAVTNVGGHLQALKACKLTVLHFAKLNRSYNGGLV